MGTISLDREFFRDLAKAALLVLVSLLHLKPMQTIYPPDACPPPGCPQPPPAPRPISPPAPTRPSNPIDPEGATGQLRFGNAGCTATVLSDRPAPGKYYVLAAAHCARGRGSVGQFTTKGGESYAVTVVKNDPKADLLLMEMVAPEGLPVANVATSEPPVGTVVWHQGYGVDRPGNREVGVVTAGPQSDGQIVMRLSVSPGDSGSGVFRQDTGELVAVVCCTSAGQTRGGGVTCIRRIMGRVLHPFGRR